MLQNAGARSLGRRIGAMQVEDPARPAAAAVSESFCVSGD
jgi:hypothetical protein